MKTILAKQLKERLNNNKDAIVIDVRATEKFEQEHIQADSAQTINLPKTIIFEDGDISHLPKDKELIITCTTGNSARKCAGILDEKGYNVILLEGGMTAWKAEK